MRPFAPYVDGYWDVENQVNEHIKGLCRQAAQQEDEEKAYIETVTDFEKRRCRIKQAFLKALGGLPPSDTPLNPQVVGTIPGQGYSIEKIIFESLPRFYVTANLYVPTGAESSPAVVFLCGHSKEAKAYPVYQKVCIALAKAGFVVLAVDPLGQGERMSYVNPKTGRLDVEWGTYEHSHAGLQCTLAGFNIARFFIHDAMRAVDYLVSRPEVDPDRIGVTGNSGGGTQTSYLMMADDRIKVAVPCTYITSREHYLLTGQAHDAEQNLYGAFSQGINYDDLLTSIAPRPVQLGAVASDFFTIEGALQSVQRAKRVYQLYGQPGNFRIVVASGVHQYADLLRIEAVKWFQYHLQGVKEIELLDTYDPSPLENPEIARKDYAEKQEPLSTLPEEMLRCTASGQVSLDMPDSRTVFDLNLANWRQNSRKPASLVELNEAIHSNNRQPQPIWARVIDHGKDPHLSWEKVFFFTEPDIAVTGIWVTADPMARPWVVLLDEGTDAVQKRPDFIRELAHDRGRVFLFDVRGTGAVKQRPVNRYRPQAIYGTEFVLNYNSVMLEDSLVWMRAFDITRALAYVQGATGMAPSLYAEGWLGVLGLAAAAVWSQENAVSHLEFHRLLRDFGAIIEERFHMGDHRLEAFDLARLLNIEELLASFQDRAKVYSWMDGRGKEA